MRIRWTDALIHSQLQQCAVDGAMPSAHNLRVLGKNALACAVSRYGGFRLWAERTGLTLQESDTKRGVDVEDQTAAFLCSRGLRVERQSTKAPFDLLVNGLRVDVKSATYSDYGDVRGFVFSLRKVPPTCDVYLLCCLSEDEQVMDRYYVPASEAKIQTLTITADGKYRQYRNSAKHLGWSF